MIVNPGPRLTTKRRRVLPIVPGHFEPTPGPRIECARQDDCIAAHLRAHPHDDCAARCKGGPRGGDGPWEVSCRWYVAPERVRATEYMGSGMGIGGET